MRSAFQCKIRRFSLPELLDIVRDAAAEKKGEDIRVIDLTGKSDIADNFLIVTGRSKIQTRAIADGVTEAARGNAFAVRRTEGYTEGSWILLDLGMVVVHIFTPEQRTFYNLERLWADTEQRRAKTL
ncbi:MAG: ribosome silencing factor [Candidatus Eremiobacteraeota bacterium]|nr:ribosome silencing factor [Candidatus Eremiobacteraeota bacterium]